MPCPSSAWLDVYGGAIREVHDVDVDLAPDPETVGMQAVPTFPHPAIPLPDASIYETWWVYHAMSGGCVAGCVWGVGPGCP